MSFLTAIAALREAPVLRTFSRRRYERFFASARGAHIFRGVYPSFEAASRAAPGDKPVGYDNDAPAKDYASMLSLHPRDYPVLFWLQKLFAGGATRVFDLGGHVGVKYYSYQAHLTFPSNLRWTVCDVEAVASEGKSLATRREATALDFTTDFSLASGADVLLAIGSIQYIEEDLSARLAQLTHPPEWLLLNSVPAYDGPNAVTLQNIGTAFCPYRLFNRAGLLASLDRVGYELLDDWENPEVTCVVPFCDLPPVEAYQGLALRRRRRPRSTTS